MTERPFAPVRELMAREREQGRSFAQAWELALASMPNAEARAILESTREVCRDAYEGRPAKVAALVMDQPGHTDAAFTLRVYRHGMRRDEASKQALAKLVGVEKAPKRHRTQNEAPAEVPNP